MTSNNIKKIESDAFERFIASTSANNHEKSYSCTTSVHKRKSQVCLNLDVSNTS
jgi:hypothetical protein